MLPTPSELSSWLRREMVELAAQHLLTAINPDVAVGLAVDPRAALRDYVGLQVVEEDHSGRGCGVYGRYDRVSSTIYYEASNWGRDNFTVLHEFGHHLQCHDPEWADILWKLRAHNLQSVEERVSDTVASLLLLPAADLTALASSARLDVELIAAAYKRSSASIQATLVRTRDTLTGLHRSFLAVADSDGTVRFSLSLHDDIAPPGRNSVQPDIARLGQIALAASSLHAHGSTSEGIAYRSGAQRTDVDLEVAVIDAGRLLVVGTVQAGRGIGSGQWQTREQECNSPSCESVFTWDDTVSVCGQCRDARCPECGTCSCTPDATTCSECSLTLSAAERARHATVCDECS